MTQRRKLLIANEWVDAAETITVRSPHTGEVVGEVAKAGPAEMERAVQAAVRGFEETRKLSSFRRSEILSRVAAGLAKRKEEMARTITSENAKTIKLSRGEVDRSIATFTIAPSRDFTRKAVPSTFSIVPRRRTSSWADAAEMP